MIDDIKKILKDMADCDECMLNDHHMEHIREIEDKVEYLEQALNQMQEQYQEKRSDVDEYLRWILEGKDLKELSDLPEHRFVKWTHKGVQFSYDTYTTLVDYENPTGEWVTIDPTYTD